jgi:hypothetical protein
MPLSSWISFSLHPNHTSSFHSYNYQSDLSIENYFIMSSYKNIALVGVSIYHLYEKDDPLTYSQASGNTGKIIIDGLLSTAKFNITVLSRKESKATFLQGITVRTTDFSETDLVNALKGQDVVISALGVEGFSQQQKIVDAAVRAGVKRFLPSEFSSSSEDPAVLRLMPLFEQKKNLIDYLKSKEKDGLTWTGLATGLLFDWVRDSRKCSKIVLTWPGPCQWLPRI